MVWCLNIGWSLSSPVCWYFPSNSGKFSAIPPVLESIRFSQHSPGAVVGGSVVVVVVVPCVGVVGPGPGFVVVVGFLVVVVGLEVVGASDLPHPTQIATTGSSELWVLKLPFPPEIVIICWHSEIMSQYSPSGSPVSNSPFTFPAASNPLFPR